MSAHAAVPLVDTHAHVQDPVFAEELDAVVARARQAGLVAFVCVGYDLESSRRAVEIAARYPDVYATVGMHPNSAGRATDADWDELRELARAEKVVGLGETGLDNYRKRTMPEVQERWLWRHLELGDELGRPVVIHNREADDRLRAILGEWCAGRRSGGVPGVMHCFSADEVMLEACLELGMMISIAGPVTFKNAGRLRDVARAVPADRLVVETDCPYLTPMPHRGDRNEPAYVAHTARFLAELRLEAPEALAARTTRNAAALFDLKIPTASGVLTS
jgi:TatD DNase family protein